jgi:hypothetical protein
MSERAKQRERTQQSRGGLDARRGATFWDGVEREIEALDVADFALFMGADRLPFEPRPAFAHALSDCLASLVRSRWSN